MKQYLDILRDIMENGQDADNRTGVYARKVFGRQARYDLSQGFPLVTTKKTFLKGIIYELLWLISGDTNIKFLLGFLDFLSCDRIHKERYFANS